VLRQQAALLAAHDHRELIRLRGPQSITFGVCFVFQVLAAVFSSPWHWFAAALFAGMLAFQVLWPRRSRRRIERLQHGGDAPTGRGQRS
jgi:Flp pilus assembly protein TadB